MAEQTIEAGDVVVHRPSGQEWLVWGVDSLHGYLLAMGWPNQLERLSDCELHEKRSPFRRLTADERRSRTQLFGRRFDDDREEDKVMDREWAL